MAIVDLRPEDVQVLLAILRSSAQPMTMTQLAEAIKAAASRAGS